MPEGNECLPHMAIGRRKFLSLGLGTALATLASSPVEAAFRPMPERALHLYNTHTGEHVKTVYWAKGRYVPEALRAASHVLRDHRSGDAHPIDPRVLDLISAVHHKFGAKGPVHIISGYRSPASNSYLASISDGVAGHSLHMEGKAVDIRIPGHSVRQIGRAAKSLRGGGVGLYPASDFVHVDSGRIRYW